MPVTYKQGIVNAFMCYISWGLFPIFWKLFTGVAALNVLAHRIIWSFVFLFIWILIIKNRTFLKYVRNPRLLIKLGLASFIICLNWGTYIYAVETNHIVEASLGYYINPLVNVLLGYVFLKERLIPMQKLAMILAFTGVLYLTVGYGKVPWISIILASSFGVYGLIKKKLKLESMPALAAETMTMVPFALAFLLFSNFSADGTAFFPSLKMGLLFITAGVVTAVPLFWFGKAASAVPLSTLGFIQYLAPTLQAFLGVVLYNEHFGFDYLVCFIFVWAGLICYTASLLRRKTIQA